jgi:hypothetical protein
MKRYLQFLPLFVISVIGKPRTYAQCCCTEIIKGKDTSFQADGSFSFHDQATCDFNARFMNYSTGGKAKVKTKFVSTFPGVGFCNKEVCSGQKYSARLAQKEILSLRSRILNDKNAVALAWDIPEQIGGFYVERSRDGQIFKTLGFVDARRGTHEFTDIYPYAVGFYRLTWVSADTTFYSQVISVVSKNNLLVSPNPANNIIHVFINNANINPAWLTIINVAGRSVVEKALTRGEEVVDISKLAQGLYVVSVSQAGEVYTYKLMKQ